MTVLIVPSWYTSKADAQLGAFFREQALALKRQGLNVIVADATLQGKEKMFSAKNFRLLRFDDEGLDTYSFTTPAFGLMRVATVGEKLYYLNLKRICRKIKRDGIKIDVIHAHSFYPAGYSALKIAKKFKTPLIITEHTSSIFASNLDKSRLFYLKKSVNQADAFICVGNALKKAVINHTNTSKQLYVLPNMVDKRFGYTLKERANHFCFVSIGNLVKSKRFDLTIEAFAAAFKDGANVSLKVIGDGPLREMLIQQVHDLGVDAQVSFLGRISRTQVIRELESANVLVLPSDFETFGVVYIEAMACGVPVIATRNGGADDIVMKEDGFLVDKGNLKQLKDAMRDMYYEYNRFDRKKISERCIARFGEEAVSQKIVELYDKILAEYDNKRI